LRIGGRQSNVVKTKAAFGTNNPLAREEAELNKKVRTLIQKLGEAIHESVSESEDIAGVVGEIREQGFDVMLMLEATIGLNELDDAKTVEPAGLLGTGNAVKTETFSASDMNFLRSLRITLPPDSPGDSAAENGGR
jgi:uncharacterized protein (UPF0335 family)